MKSLAVALAFGLLAVASAARQPDLGVGSLNVDFESQELTAELALANPELAFSLWTQQYGKKYEDGHERAQRQAVFLQNAQLVAQHNAGGASYKLALNQFADLTYEEFSKAVLGYKPSPEQAERRDAGSSSFMYADQTELPSSVDWREKGAVTRVKNQGMCGSCWAFATTGSIEGINAIRTGELVSLSEQQLVSCDREQNMGCSGGLMDYAYKYVKENGGLDDEDDYGYWAFDLPCQRRKATARHVVTIDGHENVPKNDAAALQKAIANQPVAVAICASPALQLYSHGIVDDSGCCQGLNHGVLAVGYDLSEDKGAPHYIIKNSWGGSWGESGFFRLSIASKQKSGACGVLEAASYPLKTGHSNPEVPTFCGYFGLTECPIKSQCTCNFDFFGLLCLAWGCQPSTDSAVAAA